MITNMINAWLTELRPQVLQQCWREDHQHCRQGVIHSDQCALKLCPAHMCAVTSHVDQEWCNAVMITALDRGVELLLL